MSEWSGVGRALIVAGVAIAAIGGVIAFGPRLPWLGRLPGDFVWRATAGPSTPRSARACW